MFVCFVLLVLDWPKVQVSFRSGLDTKKRLQLVAHPEGKREEKNTASRQMGATCETFFALIVIVVTLAKNYIDKNCEFFSPELEMVRRRKKFNFFFAFFSFLSKSSSKQTLLLDTQLLILFRL